MGKLWVEPYKREPCCHCRYLEYITFEDSQYVRYWTKHYCGFFKIKLIHQHIGKCSVYEKIMVELESKRNEAIFAGKTKSVDSIYDTEDQPMPPF